MSSAVHAQSDTIWSSEKKNILDKYIMLEVQMFCDANKSCETSALQAPRPFTHGWQNILRKNVFRSKSKPVKNGKEHFKHN